MGLRRKEEWEEDKKEGVEEGSGEKKWKEGRKKAKGQTHKSVRWLVIGVTLYN